MPRVFDTWSQAKDDVLDYSTPTAGDPVTPLWRSVSPPQNTTIPLYQSSTTGDKIRIIAVQISIRIWDVNTKQTRQSSVVVDL